MKNQVFIVSLVLGAGVVLTGCGNSFAAGDAQQAQTPAVKRAAAPTSISQQYNFPGFRKTSLEY